MAVLSRRVLTDTDIKLANKNTPIRIVVLYTRKLTVWENTHHIFKPALLLLPVEPKLDVKSELAWRV